MGNLGISLLLGAAVLLGGPAAADSETPSGFPGQAGEVGSRAGPEVQVSSLPDGRVPRPSRVSGTYTARVPFMTAVRVRPGLKPVRWRASGTARWSETAQRLMVLTSRSVRGRLWLKVRLPIRPNGSSGWIPRDRVELFLSRHFILIDLSERHLSLFGGGRRLARFRVVVGAPSTPTPRGLFAIYDRVKQGNPRGFTGPLVLPLTAHSRYLRRYDGGPGLVALHGRSGASLTDPLGSARSHGCIRMNNARIRGLSKVMKGTAVRIRR